MILLDICNMDIVMVVGFFYKELWMVKDFVKKYFFFFLFVCVDVFGIS